MKRPELSAEDILAVLNRHGVDYVVIGAFAAIAQGVPLEATHDVDVTPRRDDENLRRLSAALDELDARIRVDGLEEGLPFDHDASSLGSMATLNLTCAAGDFDIVFAPAAAPRVSRTWWGLPSGSGSAARTSRWPVSKTSSAPRRTPPGQGCPSGPRDPRLPQKARKRLGPHAPSRAADLQSGDENRVVACRICVGRGVGAPPAAFRPARSQPNRSFGGLFTKPPDRERYAPIGSISTG